MTTKTYELTYLDTCLPDYFQGFGGEVLAVPLSRHPRSGEVLKGLLQEIGSHGYFTADDSIYEQLRGDATQMFSALDLRKKWSSGDDLSESYAYFGIKECEYD
ncbi:hypothetical protein N5E86_15875 [Stutzerimonas stutzeri]|uniref:hypothetical protein n=1 Tax=Stutzerimonas stutzeri TaxID=316 RepID=UPI0024476704|nr:hypothetical protein [Stutzerimonas stutzeri]MDH1555932.1 hypothetical protein [Stutzerimonas stutzeri]